MTTGCSPPDITAQIARTVGQYRAVRVWRVENLVDG
jgi:hypothetical protein